MRNPEPPGVRTPPTSVVIGLIVLAAVSLLADGFFQPYAINGDVTSYFDLADQAQQGHWQWIVNGYWNPLYPMLLWLARTVAHADVWHEMQAGRLLNVATAFLVLLASVYLADTALRLSLSQTDASKENTGLARIPRSALLLSSFTVAFWLIVRNLNVNTVRPDLLLTLFLIVAFASMFNILRTAKLPYFVILGISFGLAYLTKSVAFPIFAFTLLVLAALAVGSAKGTDARRETDTGLAGHSAGKFNSVSVWRKFLDKKPFLSGIAAAVLAFAFVAGPYIYALSRKAGHFSSGESGGDNYAWYVDGAERFEQQPAQPETKGAAVDRLKHTSKQLMTNPRVYYYGDWMPGTETQWFDPSYWNAGLTPRFAPRRQLAVLVSNLSMFVRVCLSNIQIFFPLVLVILLGGRWIKRDWSPRAFGAIAIAAAALLALYMIVLFEGRYVAPSFLVLIVGSLAFAYVPSNSAVRLALTCSLLTLLAALVFSDIQSWTRSIREQKDSEGTVLGAYNREMWTAGHALISDYGVKPGDTVACYGEGACRDDLTWARLAHANIRTEVFVDQAQVLTQWSKEGSNSHFLSALRSTGAKVLVGKFPTGMTAPQPWIRLGGGNLFAFDLRDGK